VVIGEGTTNLGGEQQKRKKSRRDVYVHVEGDLAEIDSTDLIPPDVPAVQVGNKDEVVHNGVSDSCLDLGDHGALLLARGIFLPRTAILLDHTNQLDVAGHDGWDSCDETSAQEEVRDTRHVEEDRRSTEAGGEELWLERCSGIVEQVQTPGEDVEGDGEVDQSWMNWVAVDADQLRGMVLNRQCTHSELNSGTGSPTLCANLLWS
jgi:hypothetical protein